jgi:hypothetical protein
MGEARAMQENEDIIAKKVDLTLEPLMGNGICEVHVDVHSPTPATAA